MIDLASEAGKIIKKGYLLKESKLKHKGAIDLVTETDLSSEMFIKNEIRRHFPDDLILAEETANIRRTAERIWIIDPLDGTTNFVHKFPVFAVSIGLQIGSEIRFGSVYNPVSEEMFFAEKGKGAFLNGEKISVSATEQISDSLIATGFPYDRWQKGDFYVVEYLAFMKKCQGVRRVGAASLDLCFAASGRLDGFFERKLKPWDMAAGSVILSEAGGVITDFNGKKWNPFAETIVASNGKIHRQMIEILASAHENE